MAWGGPPDDAAALPAQLRRCNRSLQPQLDTDGAARAPLPACPQRKHDLVAAKNVEQVYPHWGLWGTDPGHKPGIAVGQRFSGRGQLKAVGIHSTYFTGIQTGGCVWEHRGARLGLIG